MGIIYPSGAVQIRQEYSVHAPGNGSIREHSNEMYRTETICRHINTDLKSIPIIHQIIRLVTFYHILILLSVNYYYSQERGGNVVKLALDDDNIKHFVESSTDDTKRQKGM